MHNFKANKENLVTLSKMMTSSYVLNEAYVTKRRVPTHLILIKHSVAQVAIHDKYNIDHRNGTVDPISAICLEDLSRLISF